MSQTRFEICRSCLRKKGFIQDTEEESDFLSRLHPPTDADVKLGQCQRLCPEDRLTVSIQAPRDPAPNLAMLPANSVEDLAKTIQRITLKSS